MTEESIPYDQMVPCPCKCGGMTTPDHAKALAAELAARPGQQHKAPIGMDRSPIAPDCGDSENRTAPPAPKAPEVPVQSGTKHAAPAAPREVPTAYPRQPGQLDPETPCEPVPEAPEPTVDEREREMQRRWHMARAGGTEGSADRLAVLYRDPNHPLGVSAEARP
jgi:hypothetical protein